MTTTRLWISQPHVQFAQFLTSDDFVKTGESRNPTGLPIQKSSAEVYCFMFNRFLAWMGKHSPERGLHDIKKENLELFVEELREGANSEIRWRYVRLLERTFTYLVGIGLRDDNPAKEMVVIQLKTEGRKSVKGQDEPMVFIDQTDQETLVTWALSTNQDFTKGSKWKDLRDAALVTLLMGAGLKLSEALALTTSDVIVSLQGLPDTPLQISLNVSKGVGSGKARKCYLPLVATQVFYAWIRFLKNMEGEKSAGLYVFPGTKGSCLPMDAATAYRRTRKVLEKAGINSKHLGGRTLRNSFAVSMLSNGEPPARLMKMLGLRELKSLDNYVKASKRTNNV